MHRASYVTTLIADWKMSRVDLYNLLKPHVQKTYEFNSNHLLLMLDLDESLEYAFMPWKGGPTALDDDMTTRIMVMWDMMDCGMIGVICRGTSPQLRDTVKTLLNTKDSKTGKVKLSVTEIVAVLQEQTMKGMVRRRGVACANNVLHVLFFIVASENLCKLKRKDRVQVEDNMSSFSGAITNCVKTKPKKMPQLKAVDKTAILSMCDSVDIRSITTAGLDGKIKNEKGKLVKIPKFVRGCLPLVWAAEDTSLWLEIQHSLSTSTTSILDFNIGDGSKGGACAEREEGPFSYIGMAYNKSHEDFALQVLDTKILSLMAEEGSHWYIEEKQDFIKKSFATLFPDVDDDYDAGGDSSSS